MAIVEQLTNPSPITNLLFMATKLDAQGVSGFVPSGTPQDFSYCGVECPYTELAVAKIGGTTRQNDNSSFLLSKLIAADTITFKLEKNGVVVATISDNTFGTFFPAGSLTVPENPDSALYVGFQVSWEKVITIQGVGNYKILADTVILGVSNTITSQAFRLATYSDRLADGTIRIKTIQNGNIQSSQVDYTGLNWEQNIRIKGKLFGKDPGLISDRFLNSQRSLRQIRDQIINTFTIETHLLPSNISNKIIYDLFLSNSIFVTDYNLINEDVEFCEKTYNEIELYPDEFEEPQHFNRITNRLYVFKFVDRLQNTVKDNF